MVEYTPAMRVKDGHFSIAPSAMTDAADIDSEVVHFWRPGAYNYYHWVIDTLPQLWALAQAPFADRPLLINRRDFRRPRRMSENEIDLRLSCLEALGFGPARRIEIDADICDAAVLHLPSASLGLTLGAAREIYERLRNALRPAPPAPRAERIYVTRRGAAVRRILNEPELMAALAPLGFEAVTLDGMPLAEQIDLFSAAQVVVSAHGAGLANLAFAGPGIKFLEILPANQADRRWIFGRVAAVFGHRRVIVESRPFPHDREDPDHLVSQASLCLGLELLMSS
jgi:capsular polysaccharide biosynthesis protein